MRAYCPADYAPAQLLVESSAFVPAPCHWQPAQDLDPGFAAHARQPPHDPAARVWEPPHDSPARVRESPHALSGRARQGAAGRETGYDGGWVGADGQPYPGTSLCHPLSSSRGGAAEQALFPKAYMQAYGAHAQPHTLYRAAEAWRAPGSAPYEHREYGELGSWAEQGHPAPHPGGAPAGPRRASWRAAHGPAPAHASHAREYGPAPGAGTGSSGDARQHAAEYGVLRDEAVDRVGAAAAAPERRVTVDEAHSKARGLEWGANNFEEERAALQRRAGAAEARASAAAARAEELALALAARDAELAALRRCK